MKSFKKVLARLPIFAILVLIYFTVVVGYYGCRILSLIYLIVIYSLVVLIYHCVNKKTKICNKKGKRILLIVSITVATIGLFGIIFGTVDYVMARNGKTPIFSLRSFGYSKQESFLDVDENSHYGGILYNAKEYYGLGYKLVVCDSCDKPVYFMPLGIGTYSWSIGVPIDRMNGRWFHAYSNDIYMFFDGIGHYSLSTGQKTSEEGTYTVGGDSVTLTPSSGSDIGNCTIQNNYHELHCDKYADIFMK